MYSVLHNIYITGCVIPSRYYTSLLFGRIVMVFWTYGLKFGPLVFYLIGPLDSVYGPSLRKRVEKMRFILCNRSNNKGNTLK